MKRHLTFANVASALALFLAIGGGTTAIALQGKNKVDSGDIKNRAVKTRDLANNAATGAKVNESTFTIVPDSDELDGISSEVFQLGNGISGSIAGDVEDGATNGKVDLGSATLDIDCQDTDVELRLVDDTGGTVPTAAVPTDIWVNGTHESLTSDGDASAAVALGAPPQTASVQVWTADDVVTDGQFSVYFNIADDVCVIVLPLQQTFASGSPTNSSASAKSSRLAAPTTSGITPRGG